MKRTLEICCESVHSAWLAQQAGADRVELCANLAQGGTTPSVGQIRQARALLSIPVFVLIRPRKADFLYSDLEFEQMLIDIQVAKGEGAEGIVSGVLLKDGAIDLPRTRQLVQAAHPLPFTFHRAFDMCQSPLEAIDQLAEAGVQRILTSGQKPTALEGLENLRLFAERAEGKLSLLACGELLPQNLPAILAIPFIWEYHSAARQEVYSAMEFRGGTNMGDEPVEEEFAWHEVNPEVVRQMKQTLEGFSEPPLR